MAAILLTFLGSVSVLALLKYSSHSADMTRRTLDYERARVAAEAGLDYGISELQDLIFRFQFSLTQQEMQTLVDNLPPPPVLSDYEYTSPSGDVSFRITVDTEPTQGAIPNGSVGRGELGEYQLYTITCGARNPDTGAGAVLTQRIQATSLFIMRFGVFYWYDLEINPGRTMFFDGPIHTNHDAYLTGPLEIRAPITAHGGIYHDRKDSRGPNRGSTAIYNNDGDPVQLVQDGQIIDSTSDTWMTDSLNLFDGNAQNSSHGVPQLSPPINSLDEPYDIIRRPVPPSSDEYRAETEAEKFANKAALRIHVDANGNMSAIDSRGQDVTYKLSKARLEEDGEVNGAPVFEKEDDGTYEMDDEGSYDTDQRFLDSRENQIVAPVDIYVDQLVEEFPELFSGADYGISEGRGVVYVTRDEPVGGGLMPAVRLRNGREMPSGGLTVATDLPLYVEGDFNTGDTREPSMVTGDAVTMLSNNWQDARSTSGLGDRQADSTDFNVVVMTGNTETVAGGAYNGGLENVLRFMENWSGDTARFRGSIIDLWHSEIANSPWSYGNYYTAPRRDWEFDSILSTQAPPGVPRVFGLEMLTWRVTTWAEQGWN
jgi:hypothetical protein